MQSKTNKYLLIIIIFVITACSVTREIPSGANSIYIEKSINLGGFEQAIIVRGQSNTNPVLIHLHGGPGYPLYPYLDNFKELEKHFTVVYWEQRGTGKSLNRNLNDVSMCTDSLLRDLNELVNWSLNQLHVKQTYIWGHSWGSNLGMLYINKYPEKVKAYIGTGQSVNLLENERLCYKFVKKQATENNNTKALRQLAHIDTANYELSDALTVRKWIYNYGGIVHSNYKEKPYINFGIVKKVFKTPEYNMSDKWRLLLKSKYSGKQLWDDMMKINLFKQVKQVNCPVYFFEGKYDVIVSSKLAKKYFNQLIATKGKTLVWFENSAHRSYIEEPQKFINELLKVKRANE